MIDSLIDLQIVLCVLTIAFGVPALVIGGIVELFNRKPPRSACRDWRDSHISNRR